MDADPKDLIDWDIADELFAPQEDPDGTAMQMEIWSSLRSDLSTDLEQAAREKNPEALKSHLHRIRGYCSTCALSRLGGLLRAWEDCGDPVAAASDFGSRALAMVPSSIASLETKFPHLRGAV